MDKQYAQRFADLKTQRQAAFNAALAKNRKHAQCGATGHL